ncbi:MAG: glycerol kinase, partial [Rubrivivax sp.]
TIEVEVVSIGITNQRETTVVWNKETGMPYHHAIVWNDTRTTKLCEQMEDRLGGKDCFRDTTGLPLASYFSATKLLYLLDTVEGLRQDAEAGKALFGTVDSWLLWKLTNGAVHATDVTNAARTLLMDLRSLRYSESILQQLRIPRAMLPEIFPCSHHFGLVDASLNTKLVEHEADEGLVGGYALLHNVPVTGMIGDQNAALFGQTCFHRGEAKITYGTGAFLLLNTGPQPVPSRHGLLTTLAFQLAPRSNGDLLLADAHPAHQEDADVLRGLPCYALEGSVAYSGSVVQWLRDNLQLVESAQHAEALADALPDNGGVYFVPAFAGLYAPFWREDARANIVGLTAFHTRSHVVRAALEASAFQTIDVLRAMQADTGLDLAQRRAALRVDGGLSANGAVMQLQSDLLCLPLARPRLLETTALGAAFMAGLGVGLWTNLDELKACWRVGKEYKP